MPHALAVIDVTEGSSPRDIPVKQPARYHGSSWHDADDLADATTLVRNPLCTTVEANGSVEHTFPIRCTAAITYTCPVAVKHPGCVLVSHSGPKDRIAQFATPSIEDIQEASLRQTKVPLIVLPQGFSRLSEVPKPERNSLGRVW